MASNIIDDVMAQVIDTLGTGMNFLDSDLRHDADKTLLRKLDRSYDTMTLEETLQVWDRLGHQARETTPCDACELIAKKEFQLAEDLQ